MSMRSAVTGEFPTRSTISPCPRRRCHGFGWVAKDTTTDRDVIKSLRQRAFYDPLTGLSHRSLFLDRLDLLLRRVNDDPTPVVRAVRDTRPVQGEDQPVRAGRGEPLLKAIAGGSPSTSARARACTAGATRTSSSCARRSTARTRPTRLARDIGECFTNRSIGGHEVFMTASSGVAIGARAR